jgi:hypothetical protein
MYCLPLKGGHFSTVDTFSADKYSDHHTWRSERGSKVGKISLFVKGMSFRSWQWTYYFYLKLCSCLAFPDLKAQPISVVLWIGFRFKLFAHHKDPDFCWNIMELYLKLSWWRKFMKCSWHKSRVGWLKCQSFQRPPVSPSSNLHDPRRFLEDHTLNGDRRWNLEHTDSVSTSNIKWLVCYGDRVYSWLVCYGDTTCVT